jgi:hypothetical protein
MPVPADDDVVVHRDAERGGDVDGRFGHLNIRLRGARDRRRGGCAATHLTEESHLEAGFNFISREGVCNWGQFLVTDRD